MGTMDDPRQPYALDASRLAAPPVFQEVQHFRQWWMWVVVLAVAAFMWVGFVTQIVLGQPYGSKPMPDALMWAFTLLFGLGLPAFFVALRLLTEVFADRLVVGLAPFPRRTIPLADIAEAQAVTYRPLADYGGWGVRRAGSRGTAYNASGDRGVQLVLRDGRRVLVGSQRPQELVLALRSVSAGIAAMVD
jgi:hypothetical protein